MRECYETNVDFRNYVDNYCRSYKCTVEQAFEHSIVRVVKEFYANVDK